MQITTEQSSDGQTTRVRPKGRVTVDTATQLYRQLLEISNQSGVETAIVDFSDIEEIDTSGIAVLSSCRDRFDAAQKNLRIENLSEEQKQALAMMPRSTAEAESSEPTGFLESLGDVGLEAWEHADQLFDVITDGAVAIKDLFRGKRPPRDSIAEQMLKIGVDALPIVLLLSILLGLTMAFQSAYQLKQFGANIYVANLVALSMLREFGPMITGILVAGRSGSAIAAELATMKVEEEVDALRMMGIAPRTFLILPRLVAITIVQPLLTIISDIVGIFGGLIIGVMYLKLSTDSYIQQTITSVTVWDLSNGLLKSLIFAWIIGIVSCYSGMSVKGGATGVGRVTTRSVVVSIFLIIVADSIVTTLTTFI